MRFQVLHKMLRVNSWITQIIWQWIPESVGPNVLRRTRKTANWRRLHGHR